MVEGVPGLFEMDDGEKDWLDQARFTLLAAEDLLIGGISGEAISNSFLAMVYAARAAVGKAAGESPGWEEVVESFQREALPELGLSKENQRALPIVADLYRKVICSGEMEADPHTASACLEDARSFINEVASKL
jgi:HEPN domain-containing protein